MIHSLRREAFYSGNIIRIYRLPSRRRSGTGHSVDPCRLDSALPNLRASDDASSCHGIEPLERCVVCILRVEHKT